jgi:hypothetical protein
MLADRMRMAATVKDVAGQQAYTTAGTYTFTVPTGVTEICAVCVGGGGGGNGGGYGASPGYGGNLRYVNSISVTSGESLTVVVGAGGTGGAGVVGSGGDAGTGGGGSSLKRSTTTLVAAAGNSEAAGNTGTGGNGGQSQTVQPVAVVVLEPVDTLGMAELVGHLEMASLQLAEAAEAQVAEGTLSDKLTLQIPTTF